MAEERVPVLKVELPSVPRAVEHPSVAAEDVLARRGRKRRSSDAAGANRRSLVRALVAVPDQTAVEVKHAYLDTVDRDDEPLPSLKLVDVTDGKALRTLAQPCRVAKVGSLVRAGSLYQSRALVSKIRSVHSSRKGAYRGLSKSQCG